MLHHVNPKPGLMQSHRSEPTPALSAHASSRLEAQLHGSASAHSEHPSTTRGQNLGPQNVGPPSPIKAIPARSTGHAEAVREATKGSQEGSRQVSPTSILEVAASAASWGTGTHDSGSQGSPAGSREGRSPPKGSLQPSHEASRNEFGIGSHAGSRAGSHDGSRAVSYNGSGLSDESSDGAAESDDESLPDSPLPAGTAENMVCLFDLAVAERMPSGSSASFSQHSLDMDAIASNFDSHPEMQTTAPVSQGQSTSFGRTDGNEQRNQANPHAGHRMLHNETPHTGAAIPGLLGGSLRHAQGSMADMMTHYPSEGSHRHMATDEDDPAADLPISTHAADADRVTAWRQAPYQYGPDLKSPRTSKAAPTSIQQESSMRSDFNAGSQMGPSSSDIGTDQSRPLQDGNADQTSAADFAAPSSWSDVQPRSGRQMPDVQNAPSDRHSLLPNQPASADHSRRHPEFADQQHRRAQKNDSGVTQTLEPRSSNGGNQVIGEVLTPRRPVSPGSSEGSTGSGVKGGRCPSVGSRSGSPDTYASVINELRERMPHPSPPRHSLTGDGSPRSRRRGSCSPSEGSEPSPPWARRHERFSQSSSGESEHSPSPPRQHESDFNRIFGKHQELSPPRPTPDAMHASAGIPPHAGHSLQTEQSKPALRRSLSFPSKGDVQPSETTDDAVAEVSGEGSVASIAEENEQPNSSSPSLGYLIENGLENRSPADACETRAPRGTSSTPTSRHIMSTWHSESFQDDETPSLFPRRSLQASNGPLGRSILQDWNGGSPRAMHLTDRVSFLVTFSQSRMHAPGFGELSCQQGLQVADPQPQNGLLSLQS